MSVKPEKRSWIVKLECIVEKEVICNNCTDEQAKSDPWKFAVDVRELGNKDWSVESVEPND